MIPLTGYVDRLSARPGETIEFKVSSTAAEPFSARLVRIICADPNPAGPGRIEEDIAAAFAGEYPSRIQPFHPGSYARTDAALPALTSFTAIATIWPTTPAKGEQAIVAHWDPAVDAGFALLIGAGGALTVRIGTADGPVELSLDVALRTRQWYRAWASYDGPSGTLRLGQSPLANPLAVAQAATARRAVDAPARLAAGAPVFMAARAAAPPAAHYNGKIEAPALFDNALAEATLAEATLEAAFTGADTPGLVARWDFARGIDTLAVADSGPNGLHGRIVNLPARGMTGAGWSGRETCWRHAPQDYGAIHFHDDDIYNCDWATDFAWTIPADLPSGVYGARLTCGDHTDTISFYVCPPRGRRTADLCVLASVFTHVIYGNYARSDFGPHWRERAAAWGAYPHNPWDHPEYGFSTYNFHSDGSGICHASHLRPLMSLRPGYINFGTGEGSGLRHFQADSHLIAWLEHMGTAYDIITDRELHEEGAAALAGYRAVTTGSHPEYHTAEPLMRSRATAIPAATCSTSAVTGSTGASPCTTRSPAPSRSAVVKAASAPGRPSPASISTPSTAPMAGSGDATAARPSGWPASAFTGQGLFEGSYYRRRPEADDPRVAWMFAGIDDTLLGDFGFSGGGAAGFELDRADPASARPRTRWSSLPPKVIRSTSCWCPRSC